MPRTLDALLTRLEAAKGRFGRDAAEKTTRLFAHLSRQSFREGKSLIRFHEVLLFLRAFPQSPAVVARTEKLLNTFHERIEKLSAFGVDMSLLDDFDTSGIAGTTMQDTLNFEVARWLNRRFPNCVEIAWDDYEDERAMGSTWPRWIPLLGEDADVEANIPWRRWLDAARGHERDLEWLIRRFERLQGTHRERAELYDSLRLPLRWHLGNRKFTRTRNWTRPRQIYYHTRGLMARSQVSLARELSQPAPPLLRLTKREGESVMHTIREVMAVRYRELYGTTLGDAGSVVRATLGRGVVMYFWSLPADRRLPLRAYVAGYTLKNGVPINYIEAIGLFEWMEVGFNTFYTYRQGETAWIYAQALRCLYALTGATTISVYPYQIGQRNDEAIASGAFWFYRKLGFRSGNRALEKLARIEEQKIQADSEHRTSKRILKRLADAHMFYDVNPAGIASPAVDAASTRPISSGPWDTFSTRNLGLRVNRRMAREFAGDSHHMRLASVAEVSRVLRFDAFTLAERRAIGHWSVVLALIPDLRAWSEKEKQDAAKIIRAQASGGEMKYLRLTQQHSRLRTALLRLGS